MAERFDREELEAWLRTQPRDVSIAIAARAVLRVLPVLALEFEAMRRPPSSNAMDIVLPVFRAAALPLAAAKYPARGNELASAAAAAARAAARAFASAAAARAASDAAARATATTYASASASASDAAAAIDAAIDAAADASRAAALFTDRQYINNGSGAHRLAAQPLWPSSDQGDMPGYWQALRQHLIDSRGGWDVWIRWYDAVLAGKPTPGGEDLDIYRVTLDSEEDWKKGPGHVNALIKRKEEAIAERSNVNDLTAVELMAGEPELGKSQLQEASSPRRDYFLSYSTKDEKFARWMVALIEQHGRSVYAQFKDFGAGSNFVREMMSGIANAGRFIALLSPDYEKSDHCQAEWAAAYNRDPSGRQRVILPFRIRPVELNSLATQIVYVDLVGLDEAEATQAVLRALDISRTRGAASPPWPKGEAAKSLIEAASPKAVLTEDKKIDAGPNPVFDVAVADDDLPTLPVRQRAVIRTIIEDLPPNAPKSVRNALKEYDAEILARSLRPILGLLNDMADIIEAGVKAQNAKAEWLEDSMAKAFEKFSANHELFRKHFPLDEGREATYGAVQIDEEAAQGDQLEEPFRRVEKAVAQAAEAGIATETFVRIVGALREFAQVIATQPLPPANPPLAEAGSPARPPEAERPVSRKKRLIVTAFGFFAGAVGLMASSTQLVTQDWIALSSALQKAADALSKFIFY